MEKTLGKRRVSYKIIKTVGIEKISAMNAHKVRTILTEDGTLTLLGLPFQAGEAVEVIILSSQPESTTRPVPQSNLMPLHGTVKSYDEPFEPAVDSEDWEVLK
jgi:hypothetical protein